MKSILLVQFLFLGCLFYAQSFSPEKHFGYKLGTKFTPQHEVVSYFNTLQSNFPSTVKIEKYGKTNENRDLILAFIGTTENIAKLEQIKSDHKNGSSAEKVSIVWLSYNVHGNEASGTEAAMQTAFDLVTKKQDYLKNTIVIIDPCLNPDGRDRYVNWYYQFKTKNANPNPDAAEHDEPWPGGRPNHYFFDLNRDWAWLTQVESQQRIKKYNEWLPHVHVDFHEQGINEPYYFAPAAEPYHEVISDWQREFQKGMGKNNAKYFDEKGWQYFTSKEFDLLYPSYGDTYPTFCGAIGMTYEQAGNGRAGSEIITRDGDTLTLEERVEHHVVTGLSTVEYSSNMTDKLIQEYQKFIKERKFKFKSYVLEGKFEQLKKLAELLSKHEIKYSYLPLGQKIKGYEFDTRKTGTITTENISLLVNLNQLKGTLAHVLLEPETKVADSLTYDITSWTLPFAHGLKAYGLENEMSAPFFEPTLSPAEALSSSAYAYLVRWEGMNSVQFLNQALADGIVVRKHSKGFEQGNANYPAGSFIILKSENSADIAGKLQKIASKFQINISQTMSGMVDKGSDFGYSDVEIVNKPKIALLMGDQTNSLNSGEIWHFLENEMNLPLTLISASSVASTDMSEFSILFIPEGYYETNSSISTWIEDGGKVICFGSSIESLGLSLGLSSTAIDEEKTSDEEEVKAPKAKKEKKEDVSFADAERSSLSTNVIGAIYRCKLDQTHPLCFGIDNYYTLRQSSDSYKKLENGFSPVSIAQLTDHLNGFVGYKAKPLQANSMVAGIQSKGSGQIILFTDNPIFRGFWENGKMLVANAIYQVD
ncbi:MAG: M14 metallopeptidase family protein [Bacteroidota bacterium]